MINDYDKKNPSSIEAYAKQLIGKTFRDVVREYEERSSGILFDEHSTYNVTSIPLNHRNKGGLGQIIEEKFFNYACNSESRADFYEAGVELKVTPYKKNRNGSLSAKERLVLSMIDYFSVVDESFETSHFWNKSKLILLVYYLYQKEVESNLDYRIEYASLFTPPKQDVDIIRHDFEVIVEKIKAGKAHELSEGDTLYLGAAPKATSSEDRRKQPFSEELAKPRAFTFKTSYMTYILNTYIAPGKETYESIITNQSVDSFEDYVVKQINQYRGYTLEELCALFQVNTSKKPKNLEAIIAYRMLGIKGNHAEEFVKANIVIKSIRIGRNNRIKEHMSFPNFKFVELIQEVWENSTFGNYLRETRFLFVVYKFNKDDVLELMGAQFWNIPYADLEGDVKKVWQKTKEVIQNGLIITIDKHGKSHNNLPKQSENKVSHVRPHGQNAADTYMLPDGRYYTKQCFWLKNKYIYSQIKDDLKRDL
ncbi:restriction endonuclease [Erysipelotrichaceae bacterium OH741_COT-311]|nr:restriction endonuclease [Erysipelotrichaceae bacterium OH741_COT-311]